MEENLTTEEQEKNFPWYLKRGKFFVFVCAPIALITLLFHLKKWIRKRNRKVFWVAMFGGL